MGGPHGGPGMYAHHGGPGPFVGHAAMHDARAPHPGTVPHHAGGHHAGGHAAAGGQRPAEAVQQRSVAVDVGVQ